MVIVLPLTNALVTGVRRSCTVLAGAVALLIFASTVYTFGPPVELSVAVKEVTLVLFQPATTKSVAFSGTAAVRVTTSVAAVALQTPAAFAQTPEPTTTGAVEAEAATYGPRKVPRAVRPLTPAGVTGRADFFATARARLRRP